MFRRPTYRLIVGSPKKIPFYKFECWNYGESPNKTSCLGKILEPQSH